MVDEVRSILRYTQIARGLIKMAERELVRVVTRLPRELYDALEARAEENDRAISQEVMREKPRRTGRPSYTPETAAD